MIQCPHSGACSSPPQVYTPSDFGWGIARLENFEADREVTCFRGCGKLFDVSRPVFATTALPTWKENFGRVFTSWLPPFKTVSTPTSLWSRMVKWLK